MSKYLPTVYIVDDDPSVRKSLERLLRSAGFKSEVLVSAEDFLSCGKYRHPCCLILDVRMPGISGVDLQKKLADSGAIMPIVFLTGHGDIPMSVKAMKNGAFDFLTKPCNDKDLLLSVKNALEKDKKKQKLLSGDAKIHELFRKLTPREFQVMNLVISGFLNKQAAARLGISEKTVKIHRARVMQKTKCRSLAALVRLASRAGITPLTKKT